MRDEQKTNGRRLTEVAELLRKVAELEAALRQAEEDRGQAQVRFTDLKQMEKLEHESWLFADSIVQTVRESLLVLDERLRVKTINRAFQGTFHVTAEETEGRFLYELGHGQWDIPALRTLLQEVLSKNASFQDFEVDHDFPTIGRRTMLLNARQIRWYGSKTPLILLPIEDITERKRAERELRRTLAANERIALQQLRDREFSDAIVSSIVEGVIVYGGQGEILRMNAGAEQILFTLPREG